MGVIQPFVTPINVYASQNTLRLLNRISSEIQSSLLIEWRRLDAIFLQSEQGVVYTRVYNAFKP